MHFEVFYWYLEDKKDKESKRTIKNCLIVEIVANSERHIFNKIRAERDKAIDKRFIGSKKIEIFFCVFHLNFL